MKYFSISEASAQLNIPDSTLRFYEKKGLLPLIERDDAGRRLFSEVQMALLETLVCLKNTHMPISQIKQYMDWIIEGNCTLEDRLEMMQNHKQAVLDEILLMQESLKGIDFKITRYTRQIQERNEEKDT
ncbi:MULTISPECIES: MerR family transcriptional regulator [unclassified Paenibacillus]|uniref:MerR family transcriptional regulator n=1 Tax=unclassified Paenibacillus TaxID=185978 RepID=UPI0008C5360D|nr:MULTISPECIES: MerR family transcriptional regulator [unclassified Paenibacillus]QLG37681.1 MerR family transcriptional regulator [Paenibacillus sp. E222]SEO45859.1 DNA-binding transcriptional regulator, MerR family [Paenibacillus sp. OK076]